NDTTEGSLSTNNITFNSTTWSTPQLVTVTGVDDDIQDGDISYSIIASVAESSNSQYTQLADENIAITNVDDDTANILIDPNILQIIEGSDNNYSIILTTEPIEPITISFNTDEQIEPIPDIVFDKDNWNTAQTVRVKVVDDQELQGDRDTTITHQITSPEPNYNGLTINSVFVEIEDNDSLAEISINPTILTLTEGEENATYQIGLSAKPNNPVIINFETEDPLQPISSLTFDLNNWNQPQTIEVKTVDDAIAESSQTITIRHTVNTTDPQYLQVTLPDVTTTLNDNDTASVEINQSQGSTEVSEAGITDFYEVILTSQPTANVTLTIKPDSQTDLGNGQDNSITLTFTPDNWNLPQLVTTTAIDDSIIEDEIHTSTLVHSISSSDNNYNSKTPIFIDQVETSFLTVNITENDKSFPPGTANIRLIQPVNTTEVWEGFGFDIYKVVLESEPTADVAIAINYGEQVKADQQTITFTPNNWNIPQIITIEGIEDQAIEGEQTLSINHIAQSEDSRYNALEKQIIFNIEDNDNVDEELNLYADNIIGLTDKDNQIQGSEMDDIIYGRDGNDELMGQGGNDLILGQKGADGLMGEAGNDVLIGGNRTDFIDGGIGDDILFGGEGNDRLYGKEGNDKLLGDFGNDRLDGGEGVDTLTGYIGNDAFVIGNNLEIKLLNEVDIITDFKLTEDKIELPPGLTFEQLKITQGQNQWSQDTIIQLNSNGNYLAILQKITAINLDRGDFL
ncbi:MAG TPA: calcium-binding protein, partial [Candidatus Obscuribacterales bacterium]